MTWVIGACPALGGYAVSVSDIQVTFDDGRTFDLVRKAYPVGPNIIGAFAGSTYIGFELLASVATFLHLPPSVPSGGWHPAWVAEKWAPIARQVYERSDNRQKRHGAQILLVGPDPVEDVGIPGRAMPYLCKLSAPEFRPEITRGGSSAISIGSGSKVPEYAKSIRDLVNPFATADGGILQLEVNNTGGWAFGFNMAVCYMLEENPIPGISQHIHTHIAAREGFQVLNSDRAVNLGTPEERQVRMPRVAQSFLELIDLAKRLDVDAASAIA